MSAETVQWLSREQFTNLRRQLREHDRQAVTGSGPALLPACPACGAETERLLSQAEDPPFNVDERAVRYHWLPCGHRFRAVVDTDEEPAVQVTLDNSAAKYTPTQPLKPHYPDEDQP